MLPQVLCWMSRPRGRQAQELPPTPTPLFWLRLRGRPRDEARSGCPSPVPRKQGPSLLQPEGSRWPALAGKGRDHLLAGPFCGSICL